MTQSTLNGEAVAAVVRLTREAETLLYPRHEPEHVYYLRRADGEYERHEVLLAARRQTTLHDLTSLSSMLRAYEDAAGPQDALALEGVYVSDSQVVAILEDHHQRVSVKLPLPLHPAFALVSSFQKPTRYTQKALVMLLRTQLVDHVDPQVIRLFEKLRFSSSINAAVTQQPMNASMDRSIAQAVKTETGTDVPAQIEFRVPVYDVRELRTQQQAIPVYVEYDHDASEFVLVAVHNRLREAQETAQAWVIDHLGGVLTSDAPVLAGVPG
jgi:hypothetical protein